MPWNTEMMEGYCMASHRFQPNFYNISRTILVFVILVFGGAGILFAEETGTLKGEVKDVDGLALPGVNVTASGTGGTKNGYTDINGAFTLVGLPAGLYDVTIELAGFVTITQTDVQINAGDNSITFTMKTSGITELMVVSASRVETSLINAPATMSVVQSETIEASSAQNYGDLLRSVPGLNVIQTSARDINLTSRQATSTLATSQLALLDGRSIYLDFFGLILWDFIPSNPNDISQIEVVRGPASAVWGANALTGVVNIITKSPRETPGVTSVTLNTAWFGRDDCSIVLLITT